MAWQKCAWRLYRSVTRVVLAVPGNQSAAGVAPEELFRTLSMAMRRSPFLAR